MQPLPLLHLMGWGRATSEAFLLLEDVYLFTFHSKCDEKVPWLQKWKKQNVHSKVSPRRQPQEGKDRPIHHPVWYGMFQKIYYTPKHAFVVWDLLKVSRRCSLVRKFQRGQRCSWILLNIHLWCYRLTSRPRWLSLHSRTHRQRTHLELGPPYTFHSLLYVKTE